MLAILTRTYTVQNVQRFNVPSTYLVLRFLVSNNLDRFARTKLIAKVVNGLKQTSLLAKKVFGGAYKTFRV